METRRLLYFVEICTAGSLTREQITDAYFAGDHEGAAAAYARWLPLINYENRQCGLIAAKILMAEGGVIKSEATRHPVLPLHPATRAGLIAIAKRTNPMVLRWSK